MRRRRVNITRARLEELAWHNRTQVEFDYVRNIATTCIDGIDFWASIDAREVW